MYLYLSVCRSVCLSVCHNSESSKNGWTDRNAVWVVDCGQSGGPKEECVRFGAHWLHLTTTTEPSICGGDAAFLSNYFDKTLFPFCSNFFSLCVDLSTILEILWHAGFTVFKWRLYFLIRTYTPMRQMSLVTSCSDNARWHACALDVCIYRPRSVSGTVTWSQVPDSVMRSTFK